MVTVIGKSNDAELLARLLKCKINCLESKVAIRYGDNRELKDDVFEINKKEAIELAKDKYETLVAFRGNGLPIPNFNVIIYNLSFPVLGRKYNHFGGNDIIFIEEKDKDKKFECDYFIEFLPVQDEYRCHIFNGDFVSLCIKDGGDKNSICRNLKSGWKFKEIEKFDLLHFELIFYSKQAINVLGLHFGAVDLIISDGKIYLLEVNTAPGLIPRRMKRYSKKITSFINNNNF